MVVIIYRGMGILVPILLLIVGWIVSFWYTDTRIGNPSFMGWTLFYTSIVCLLLGLALIGDSKEADENGRALPKKRHHFFFIPVIVWALIFGGISAYLLLANGKKEESNTSAQSSQAAQPVIHFYNPSEDTLDYLIYRKDGITDQDKLEPYASIRISVPAQSYVLGSLDAKGEPVMTLPYYEKYDASLYETVTEDGKKVEQRRIRPLSPEPDDYEDNWMLLDGTYDLLLVDVSDIYDLTVQKDKVAQIDWMKKIKSRHEGTELIELKLKPAIAGGSVYVGGPNTPLPSTNPRNRLVYLLVDLGHDEQPDNELIRKSVEHVLE